MAQELPVLLDVHQKPLVAAFREILRLQVHYVIKKQWVAGEIRLRRCGNMRYLLESGLGHDVQRRLEKLRQGLLLLTHVLAVLPRRERSRNFLDVLVLCGVCGMRRVSVVSENSGRVF